MVRDGTHFSAVGFLSMRWCQCCHVESSTFVLLTDFYSIGDVRSSATLSRKEKKKIHTFLHNGMSEPFIVATTMSSALKGASLPGAVATLPWRQLV